jgi:small nuclear ribonucleoprotein (snRNP)-like protein
LSTTQRRYLREVAALLDKVVTVVTIDGKEFTGMLVGVKPENLSVCLSGAIDESGKSLHRVVLNGIVVAKVSAVEKPFDLKALSQRLEKVFPTMVRLYEGQGFIWVMEKIKVTEKGVVEGRGPAAERVQNVYTQFLKELEPKSTT